MRKCTVISVLFFILIPAFTIHARIDVSTCAGTQPQEEINEDCMAVMESFPEPAVIPIQRDGTSLNNYSFWRVRADQPALYDAPGGNFIRNMASGYNFVRVVDSTDGWVNIASGEWMSSEGLEYKEASDFVGVRILDGLENRFAWVLGTHVTSPYPGAKQDLETGRVVYRYDRVNIFAEAVDDEGWTWYMVGPDEWIDQRMLTVADKIERPEGVEGRWVAIDLYEQSLVAYENDTPVFATVIATGLPGSDTNEGLFEVWAALEVDGMSGATGAPTAYDLQSVPWVMYFDDSISLHGTYWHDDFGYRRSRGCVNLSISDARHIFRWFEENPAVDDNGDPLPSYVYVHSSNEYRSSGAATK